MTVKESKKIEEISARHTYFVNYTRHHNGDNENEADESLIHVHKHHSEE